MNIKLCEQCDGHGERYVYIDIDEKKWATCETCKGSGRLIYKEYLMEVPYFSNSLVEKPYRAEVLEADEKIIGIIQELKRRL